MIQALLGRQHLLVPRRQPRGRGQALEIVGPERGGRIRQRQGVEGVVPLVALETGPPPFQESRRLGGFHPCRAFVTKKQATINPPRMRVTWKAYSIAIRPPTLPMLRV